MSQKEDILEQIVEEYLTHEGYFVQHNIKYRPLSHRQTRSDIDVLAINPKKRGVSRVYVVNVKSWQAGFGFRTQMKRTRENKKAMRELMIQSWANAFCDEIERRTGQRRFTYVLAVTKTKQKEDKHLWTKNADFKRKLRGNPIIVLCLETMIKKVLKQTTTTLAATDIGRTIQLFKSANVLKGQ